MKFEISLQFVITVLAAIASAWVLIHLAPLILLSFLALLVAVTLNPVVAAVERRGISRWVGVVGVGVALLAVIAGVVFLLIPPLVDQIGNLATQWPSIREEILAKLPDDSTIQPTVRSFLTHPGINRGQIPNYLVSVGGLAIGGIAEVALCLVMSLYFLADGPRAIRWFVAFFDPVRRAKLERTFVGTSRVISAYVAGQFITSLLCSIYAFVVLRAFDVPAALTLGVLAGIFDVLPIVGIFLFAVPAVLLAMTVSAKAAISVALLYGAYHLIEAYLLVPKIYGNRMRISDLAVLLALLAGGSLAGILGAIAILPVVASYPIIERIWLARYLGYEVIEKHVAQEHENEKDKDKENDKAQDQQGQARSA